MCKNTKTTYRYPPGSFHCSTVCVGRYGTYGIKQRKGGGHCAMKQYNAQGLGHSLLVPPRLAPDHRYSLTDEPNVMHRLACISWIMTIRQVGTVATSKCEHLFSERIPERYRYQRYFRLVRYYGTRQVGLVGTVLVAITFKTLILSTYLPVRYQNL